MQKLRAILLMAANVATGAGVHAAGNYWAFSLARAGGKHYKSMVSGLGSVQAAGASIMLCQTTPEKKAYVQVFPMLPLVGVLGTCLLVRRAATRFGTKRRAKNHLHQGGRADDAESQATYGFANGSTLCGSSNGNQLVMIQTRTSHGVSGTRRALGDSDLEVGIGAGGVIASCIVLWSEYTLKTTGRGLPEGPGGLLGGLEGISYLAIIGLVAFSLYTKITTGSGLPAGKFGLVGAAEGLSYLSLLAGLVVLYFQIAEVGYLDFAPFPLRIDFKGRDDQ